MPAKHNSSNHLGNVLTAISDKKLGLDDDINAISDSYIPEILSKTDYYPFGLASSAEALREGGEMADRSTSAENYRFGFNACPPKS